MSAVVYLDDYRKRPAQPEAHAEVRGGRVIVRFGGAQIELSPESARVWARGLAELANVAEVTP